MGSIVLALILQALGVLFFWGGYGADQPAPLLGFGIGLTLTAFFVMLVGIKKYFLGDILAELRALNGLLPGEIRAKK